MRFFIFVKAFPIFLIISLFVVFVQPTNCQTILDTVYVIGEKYLSPEEEWKLKAIEDMENGEFHLLVFGMVIHIVETLDEVNLEKRYGFTYQYEGCNYPPGGNSYNKEVMKYLDSLNGKGWYDKFIKEFKALEDSALQKFNQNK